MKKTLLALSALLMGLTSCSKTEGPGNGPGGDMQIFVKTQMGAQLIDGRAVTDPVVDGTAVVFGDGYLVFTESNGTISKIVDINTTGGNGAITRTNLENGVMIGSVPKATTGVMLLANLPAKVVMPSVGDNISDIQVAAMALDILDQTDAATRGISKATLFGTGTLRNYTPDPTNTDIKQADFVVSPLISRIEVNEIAIDGDIDEATLDGIFINYYVDKMYANGKIAGTLVNNGVDPTKYALNQGGYTTAMMGYNFDIPTAGDADFDKGAGETSIVADKNDSDKIWGYNVYASGVPHTILKLSGVKVSGSDYTNAVTNNAGEAYITVKGFIDNATGKEVAAFEGGKVYKITSLLFDDSNLNPIPEPDQDEVAVWVTVTILDWVVVDSDPIFS